MQIKLTRPLRGDEGTKKTGAIVTRPDAVARKLIDRGLATKYDGDEAAAAEPAEADAGNADPAAKAETPPKRKTHRKGATAPKGA